MITAVLVIDVQQALCIDAEAAFDVTGVIGRINAIGAKAPAVGAPVVLIQHEEADGRSNSAAMAGNSRQEFRRAQTMYGFARRPRTRLT
jgi:nicotinamidase-related amidase